MKDLLIEKKYFEDGFDYVVGTDEAGRGCLAGPVVAASVAIKKGQVINQDLLDHVKDSKKISSKKRNELFELILKDIEHVRVGLCSNIVIDKINILNASLLAMKKSFEKLGLEKTILLVDGNKEIPKLGTTQQTIIKGDSKLFVIAAASIIAKVSRDKIMEEYDEKYPEYDFKRHKAYGTKLHVEKLEQHGPCPIHRFSFRPVKENVKK